MFSKNTTATGNKAEAQVCEHLRAQGHKILDTNWRTRSCEIDIVSQKDKCIYFTEVKFRRNKQYGAGLETITTSKLKQMSYAAQQWVQKNDWNDDYALLAAGVDDSGRIELVECL